MKAIRDPAIRQTNIQIFLRFLRYGFLAFGGPVAQIAMLKQELVEDEKWVSREEFNRALAVYQVLPGPEAHEMCVWFGMMAGGRTGGLLAGLGFMLPGFLLMLVFTWVYFAFGIDHPALKSLFIGFNVAVVALIVNAVRRIGQHALTTRGLFAIAIVSAVASYFGVVFIITLVVLGFAYLLYTKRQFLISGLLIVLLIAYGVFIVSREGENILANGDTVENVNDNSPATVFLTGLKAGLLTFGGAYTAIPFIERDAVQKYHWLTSEQFLDGIALSGILPAPLIIFSAFAGYAALGFPGALLITLGIFLPAFAFALLGHTFFQRIIQNKSLHSFLDGVTAAVIGIIGVTAIKLFINTITDWMGAIVFLISMVMLLTLKSKLISVWIIGIAGIMMLCRFFYSS